ncbi:MAG: hypothetical protein NTY19_04635 [Planctomycetota bacterium]|nr:hypothetical protein [Planctomycetota bacterium]
MSPQEDLKKMPESALNQFDLNPLESFRRAICQTSPQLARPISQWVEQEITIPTGQYAGNPFRHWRHPVSRIWFQELDRNYWWRHAVVAPTQNGKSFVGYAPHQVPIYKFCAWANRDLAFMAEVRRLAKGHGEGQLRTTPYRAPNNKSPNVIYIGNDYWIARPKQGKTEFKGVQLVHVNSDIWKTAVYEGFTVKPDAEGIPTISGPCLPKCSSQPCRRGLKSGTTSSVSGSTLVRLGPLWRLQSGQAKARFAASSMPPC